MSAAHGAKRAESFVMGYSLFDQCQGHKHNHLFGHVGRHFHFAVHSHDRQICGQDFQKLVNGRHPDPTEILAETIVGGNLGFFSGLVQCPQQEFARALLALWRDMKSMCTTILPAYRHANVARAHSIHDGPLRTGLRYVSQKAHGILGIDLALSNG